MQHYFVDKKNQNFYFKDCDFHHVKNVMRIKNMGEIVCIYDKKKYLCQIEYVANSYHIHILHEIEETKELKIDIILYQALIKNDKFDLVIQKATELGVAGIVGLICNRSIIKIDEKNMPSKIQRYQKIIKEACEQSTRSIIPSFLNYCHIKDIVLEKDTLGLIAYEKNKETESFVEKLKNLSKYKKIALVIGPEGGFEPSEVEALIAKGFHSISLGNRILRSETAAIASLAILSHYIESYGD